MRRRPSDHQASTRGDGTGDHGDAAPVGRWQRVGRWGIGATAAVVLLLVPIIIVANAVSDDGDSDRRGSQPVGQDVDADPGTGTPDWRLSWYDEFDGPALDAGKWMTCLSGYDPAKPCQGATAGEQQKYTPAQVALADGGLQLTAERKPVDGSPFSSGAVSTGAVAGQPFDRSRALFEPGVYLEARVRLPRGSALWPAMWLMPMEPKAPFRPEIDVFEFGGEQHTAQSRLHSAGPCLPERGEVRGISTCYGELVRPDGYFADDYRLFGVDWQADRLTYYVDGQPVLSVVGDAVPREKMYLIFTLAVGGIMGGDTVQTPARSTMTVDYVRAWQNRGTGPGRPPLGAPNDGSGPPPNATVPPGPPGVSPSPSPSPSAPATSPSPPRPSSSAPKPPASTASSPAAPRPPSSSAPPPPPQGDPWLEFLTPADYSTVRGVITVKVRVNGPRERVQEVSFYVNSKDCNSPKGDATWLGMDRDNDKDGIYVFTIDTRPLSNGCNTISTVGIDHIDDQRYYPPIGRVHLDVYVAN